jgi:hypothetical protein
VVQEILDEIVDHFSRTESVELMCEVVSSFLDQGLYCGTAPSQTLALGDGLVQALEALEYLPFRRRATLFVQQIEGATHRSRGTCFAGLRLATCTVHRQASDPSSPTGVARSACHNTF